MIAYPTHTNFLGPGMTGTEVSKVQRLIGVPVTGEYDQATTERVRGLQTLHKMPMCDGLFDRDLEDQLVRGMSS